MTGRAALAVALALLAACSEEPIPTPRSETAELTARPAPGRAALRPAASSPNCPANPAFAAAARTNADRMTTLAFAPFGRSELGWATYAPLVAREIGVDCPPDHPGFAAALAAWERGQGLSPDGVVDEATFDRMRALWHGRRPFVAELADGVCPPGPAEAELASGRPEEGYGGEIARLKPEALAAYRAMTAAARAEVPAIAADPEALTLFSTHRPPSEALARCGAGGCDGVARTWCSAHGTGLAIDLVVGAAPGMRVDSSDDANRRFMSTTPAYRWMAANADRFGFVPYPFEPWHWEYVGPEVSR